MEHLIIYGGDIDEFIKCPYRLLKCKCEGIKPINLLDSAFINEVLLKAGYDFEDAVMNDIGRQNTTESLETLLRRRGTIGHPPITLDGHEIKDKDFRDAFSDITFKGCPDILYSDGDNNCVLFDIKSHLAVKREDIFRIHFYAFILKLKYDIDVPIGYIVLKDLRLAPIHLSIPVFEKLVEMICDIASVMRGGECSHFKPQRSSACLSCSLWEQCLLHLKKAGDLTLLHRVGAKRAKWLNDHGISNIAALAECNLDAIKGKDVKDKIKKLKLEAQAFFECRGILTGDIENLPENTVYFDIETEYIGEQRVWLIGCLHKGEFHQFYANDWEQEKLILTEFLDFLKSVDKTVLCSYSSSNFDTNNVLKALRRLKMSTKFFERLPHYNLCLILEKNYISPIQNYKLKELAKFFGYKFNHDELDALNAASAYDEHLRTKEALPSWVFEYNRDDVFVIPFILEAVKRESAR